MVPSSFECRRRLIDRVLFLMLQKNKRIFGDLIVYLLGTRHVTPSLPELDRTVVPLSS